MQHSEEAVERLYRSHFGQLVAMLLNRYRDLSLEAVEDLVQDAFTAAVTEWSLHGVPVNPAGWVYIVARNRAINRLKSDRKMWVVADPGQLTGDPGWEGLPLSSGEGAGLRQPGVRDEQLRLLFACAHPDLSPKVQVVITLKYVINLRLEAIARALGMTVEGIDKLLFRARKKIREEKLLLTEPGAAGLARRRPIVHKIIYLIYNEGYKPAAGDRALKEELCGEALLLSKDLLDSGLGNRSTAALHALMLFNSARLEARTSPGGQLLDLEEQDRERWSKPLIMMGCDYLRQAGSVEGGGLGSGMGLQSADSAMEGAGGERGEVSTYHYEACIAWAHCTAKSWEATDWGLIRQLYERLMEFGPNPFVELSYAIALYYDGRKAPAFTLLHRLLQSPMLHQYYLLNATLGKLYLLEGEIVRGREFLLRALRQADLPAEQAFIRRKLKVAEGPGLGKSIP